MRTIFKLEIETENAAFESPEFEIARILKDVAAKVERGQTSGAILDINGNKVGYYSD